MRRSPVLAVLSLLLLAGCVADGGDRDAGDGAGPGDGTPQPALPTTLDVPTLLPEVNLGPGAGEPNIAVAPDGTVYVSDPSIGVWRSTDGGQSFTKAAARGITGGGDGDIVITDDGCIHWLGLFGTAPNGEEAPIPYQRSCDGGATFSDAVDLSNETGSDREWLGGRRDGTLYASWRDSDAGGIIATRTSFDGGLTWQPRVTMAPDAVGGPIVPGPVPGQVFEAMTTFADLPAGGEVPSAIQLARSLDHGATWSLLPVLTPAQGPQVGLIGFPTSIFPVVTLDDAGNLYLVFSADQRTVPTATLPKPAARFSVYLMVSEDLGETWSAPRLVSDPDKVALMPWAAAGADGRLAITWYENTVGLPADVLPDAWNVKLWESIAATDPAGDSVTVQLNGLPNHIGAVCTSGTGCLAGDRSLLDFFEVDIKADGHPIAVWSYSVVGTGVGVSAQGVDLYVGGVLDGTPLR